MGNITNMIPSDEEKLVQNPMSDGNVDEIVGTPDSKSFKRKRREDKSNEENKSDKIFQTSPVHKRRRPSKELVTKLESNGTLISNDNIDKSPVNPCEENEEILNLFEDDDLFACLDEDSFSESTNVKSLESKTGCRKTLASSYGRHKVIDVQEINSSLILTLRGDACVGERTLTL